MKFVIIVFTTQGCEACRILLNIISKEISKFNNITCIEHEIGNSEADINYAKSLALNDYPTAIMVSEDAAFSNLTGEELNKHALGRITGTVPAREINIFINQCMLKAFQQMK